MIKSVCPLPDGRFLTYYTVGQGRPLVCLHGWAMSAAVYQEMTELLSPDYQLFIPDLPGHGESTAPLNYNLPTVAADLSFWLKSILTSSFSVLGWSLGGMLALELAQNQQLALQKLVLIGTTPQFIADDEWPHGLPGTQVRALARNLSRRFEKTLGEFFALSFAGEDIPADRLRDIRRFAVYSSSPPGLEAALGYLEILASQNQRSALKCITQPGLVLHGSLDRIAPVSAGRQLAKELPHGTLVEFPGLSHGLFLSRPEQVADEIRRFC